MSNAKPVNADLFLKSSALTAPQTDNLHKSYQGVAELTASPAGWHGADDIPTLEGLAGNYLWSEDPLSVKVIHLAFDPGHVGSQGTYSLTSGVIVVEQGTFFCVPNNPAIGWAALNLAPTVGPVRSFVFAGIMTDANWKIIIALLNKLGSSGPVLPAFSAVRIS